jgi:hypothetical protein
MSKNVLFCAMLLLFSCRSFSQDLKIPEEKITGEDLRIEKSSIFLNPVPSVDVSFPEIPLMAEEEGTAEGVEEAPDLPEDELPADKEGWNKGLFLMSVDARGSAGIFMSYPLCRGEECRLLGLEAFSGEGYRDNDASSKVHFSYMFEKNLNKFSAGVRRGYLQLPGPAYNPFNIERDYLSFDTDYLHNWSPSFISEAGQTFYNIDGREINYGRLALFFRSGGVTLKTELERYDVFSETFFESAFYQGLFWEGRNIKIGGGIKKTGDYGVKFLPFMEFNPGTGFVLSFKGIYATPNLWEDIITCNYKEIPDVGLAPDEEYRLDMIFGRQHGSFGMNLGFRQSYVRNGYTWADMDKNGLLEPFAEEYFRTSATVNFEYKASENIRFFLDGEKKFTTRDTYFSPEEKIDAGIMLKFAPFSFKLWSAYTGKRRFAGGNLDGHNLLNSEFRLAQNKNTEWGIGVYNIAGEKYSVVPGYPAEGRSLSGFIRIYF